MNTHAHILTEEWVTFPPFVCVYVCMFVEVVTASVGDAIGTVRHRHRRWEWPAGRQRRACRCGGGDEVVAVSQREGRRRPEGSINPDP